MSGRLASVFRGLAALAAEIENAQQQERKADQTADVAEVHLIGNVGVDLRHREHRQQDAHDTLARDHAGGIEDAGFL